MFEDLLDQREGTRLDVNEDGQPQIGRHAPHLGVDVQLTEIAQEAAVLLRLGKGLDHHIPGPRNFFNSVVCFVCLFCFSHPR